jgi:hypothetical protein
MHPRAQRGAWPRASITRTARPTHGYEPTREAAMAAFREELAAG